MDKEFKKMQKLMTYNDDGEGVINGKTIRELEAENMKNYSNKHKKVSFDSETNKALGKELLKIGYFEIKEKIEKFIKDNMEIFIGIGISLLFIYIYYIFSTDDKGINCSLLGGILGGLGAILSILLSIAFSKRSNEQVLDSSVLPYIIMKKRIEPAETYISFEFFYSKENDFCGWKPFDFNTIKDNKRALVRNGIAYLHLENIGLGPAKKMEIRIANFSSLFLDMDYLKPNESMDIILNFNNPNDSKNTDITIQYETIRNIKHIQKFKANITWHLDRTNFTLFS
jgi:hypothetical protein